LVGLQPDIILTGSTPATVAVQQQTGTIPIIFASVSIVARVTPPERRNVAEARSDAPPAAAHSNIALVAAHLRVDVALSASPTVELDGLYGWLLSVLLWLSPPTRSWRSPCGGIVTVTAPTVGW
jgi:hypothetical protein